MKLISAGMMKPTSIIICESGTDKIFSGYKHLENEFVLLKQNKYGISYITLLQKVWMHGKNRNCAGQLRPDNARVMPTSCGGRRLFTTG
jgi:hypothetical protein